MQHPYSKNRYIYCQDTGEKITGDNYLSSNHWKQMREKVYNHYKGTCQSCGDAIPINSAVVHHRTYKRIGNEKMSDLMLYCPKCHMIIHRGKHDIHDLNKSLTKLIQSLSIKEKQYLYDFIVNKLDLSDGKCEKAPIKPKRNSKRIYPNNTKTTRLTCPNYYYGYCKVSIKSNGKHDKCSLLNHSYCDNYPA